MGQAPAASPEIDKAGWWIPIHGRSMWPRLRTGDQAELTDRSHRLIRAGDVVVARVLGKLVIHRVVGLTEDRVELRGDNSADADPPIPRENIVGVVLRIRRGKAVLEAADWDRRPGALCLLSMRLRERARLLCARSP